MVETWFEISPAFGRLWKKKNICITTSFFEYNPKANDSYIWKKILAQRDLMRKDIRWKIGNGQSINFWLDNWLGQTNLCSLLNINSKTVDMDLKLGQFITSDHCWNLTNLNQFLPRHVILKVQGIPLPTTDLSDTPIWGPTPSGLFTIKSTTWLAHDLPPKSPWPFRWIWKLDIPPKLQIFVWQICHNNLDG